MQIHVLASSHWMWVECCHHNYVNMVSLFFCNLQVTILKTWRFHSFIYLFIIIIFDMEERHHLHRVFTQSPLEEMHSNSIKSTRKCISLVLRVLKTLQQWYQIHCFKLYIWDLHSTKYVIVPLPSDQPHTKLDVMCSEILNSKSSYIWNTI